jgi:RNA polymerase sigma factor (sigma-70 family)
MIVGTSKCRREISVDNSSKSADEEPSAARACNDTEAFVQLYRSHYDAVFCHCVHRLFERQMAEDVTSEVLLKVAENINGFKGNQKQFRCWLCKIATKAVNNHLRKAARRNRLLKAVHEQPNNRTTDCSEAAEKLELLRKAVFTLRPRYQTIVTLRFFMLSSGICTF